jgi:hypothetical protein
MSFGSGLVLLKRIEARKAEERRKGKGCDEESAFM